MATNVVDRTPISGANFFGKSSAGGGNGQYFSFGFNLTDKIIAVGGTILSRESNAGTQPGKVLFSDGSFNEITTSQLGVNASYDSFWGFQVTEAQRNAGIFITGLQFNLSGYRGLDDLAFAVVPEPSLGLLFALGLGGGSFSNVVAESI